MKNTSWKVEVIFNLPSTLSIPYNISFEGKKYSSIRLFRRVERYLTSAPLSLTIFRSKKYRSRMEIIIEIIVILNCSRLHRRIGDIYFASLYPSYTYILLGKGLLTDTVLSACPLLSSWKRCGRRREHDVWSNSTWQPRRTTASVCARACVVPSRWHSAYPEIRYRR